VAVGLTSHRHPLAYPARVARTPRSNIEIIWSDWLDAIRRGDLDTLAGRLAPEVTRRGVRADLICPDRESVLENARARSDELPEVGAVELVAAGDHVVVSIRAPTVGMPLEDGAPMRGQASIVFTLRDGLITGMQDNVSRGEALAAAGAEPAVWV
jgi:ketosteroid isomerase-like protein